MNKSSRLLNAYRRISDGRPVLSIYSRYLPRGGRERGARELGLALVDNYPIVSLIAPPWHLSPGYVSETHGIEFTISYHWTNGTKVEKRTYNTPHGSVWQETTVDPSFGSDWIQRFYIKKPEDYQIVRYIVENSVLRLQEKEFQHRVDDMGADGVVVARVDRSPYQKLLVELAGPERFLMDLYSAPEIVEPLFQALERKMDEALRMVMNTGVELIWYPDNLTCEMTPPKMYEKYHLPFYGKFGSWAREAGKISIVHMDGRLRPLAALIDRSPLDVVESFSLPIIGGDLTLAEAATLWPGKAIFPNFPASLSKESRRKIGEFLDELYGQMPSSRPFVLQFSEDIPHEDWQHVVSAVADYFASEHWRQQIAV